MEDTSKPEPSKPACEEDIARDLLAAALNGEFSIRGKDIPAGWFPAGDLQSLVSLARSFEPHAKRFAEQVTALGLDELVSRLRARSITHAWPTALAELQRRAVLSTVEVLHGSLGTSISAGDLARVREDISILTTAISNPRAAVQAPSAILSATPVGAWGDIFETQPPEAPCLITRRTKHDGDVPWMPQGVLALLAAQPGTGKGFLTLHMACAVTSGAPLIGRFDIENPGSVAIFAAEERRADIARRLYAVAQEMGLSPTQIARVKERLWVLPMHGERTHFAEKDRAQNLTESSVLGDLRRMLQQRANDWRLVIIDPLVNVNPADENDNGAAGAICSMLTGLTKVPGDPSVLVVHHIRKPERATKASGFVPMSEIRGAGAFVGAADFVLTMGPIQDTSPNGVPVEVGVRIATVKIKNGPRAPSFAVKRVEGGALREIPPGALKVELCESDDDEDESE